VLLAKTVLLSRNSALIENQPLGIGSRSRTVISTFHQLFGSYAPDKSNE